MSESKVCLEVAEDAFNAFGEAMCLDFRTEGLDEDSKSGFISNKKRLIAYIQLGALTFNDNSEPVLYPQRTPDYKGKAITFHEQDGACYQSMDGKKEGANIAKLYAIMSAMTGETPAALSKLKGADAKVAQAVVSLFLAA